MPQVSVIIPTYNRAAMLLRAVDAVLNQTWRDFELIVVDDGSTDDTRRLLAAYGNKLRCITISHQGVSAARNHGVAEARGRWVAFLDSDDEWLPEKLAIQTACMETAAQKDPKHRVCQTEEIWIRNGQRVNPMKKHQKKGGMIFEPSLALCLVSPSAVMIERRFFLDMGGFDETLPACEDYDLWLRIACQYPVDLIDKALVVKRGGHADQLSARPCLDQYRIKALVKLVKSGVLTPSQHQSAVNMMQQKARIYAKGCRKHGREEEARRITALVHSVLNAS